MIYFKVIILLDWRLESCSSGTSFTCMS